MKSCYLECRLLDSQARHHRVRYVLQRVSLGGGVESMQVIMVAFSRLNFAAGPVMFEADAVFVQVACDEQ